MSGFAADYVDVASRIAAFYAQYPDGSLQMDPPEFREIDGKMVIIGRGYAYRTPEDTRPGIGHAWELVPGTTPYTRGSELMNLETSVWGRCLAALGIATKKGIATHEEVQSAKARQGEGPDIGPSTRGFQAAQSFQKMSDKQKKFIRDLCVKDGFDTEGPALGYVNACLDAEQLPRVKKFDDLSFAWASAVIKHMQAGQVLLRLHMQFEEEQGEQA